MWTYPLDPEDSLDSQASLLGSFWPSTYGGAELVLDYVRATALAEKALLRRLNDVYDGLSRLTSPVFRRLLWMPLTLRRSQATAAVGGTSYPAPAGLAGGLALADALTASSVFWVTGLDFSVDPAGGTVTFPADPFGSPLLAREPVPDDAADQQITLWMFQADIDDDLVSRRLGYQLGLEMPSSVASQALLNALLDCVTTGTTLDGLRRCLDVLADAPRAAGDETVVDLYREADRQWVLTDRNAYRLGSGANVLVQTGQALGPGDYLADAAVLYEVARGQGPALDSLTLPAGWLTGVRGPLSFPAAPTPLLVSTQDGYTRLDWALAGDPADVQTFFDNLHANGVAAGKTLAGYLDTRPDPQGQPGAASLPATVSPLRMLYENVLRGNTLVAVLRAGGFGPDAPGVDYLRVLRGVTPPHVALLTVNL